VIGSMASGVGVKGEERIFGKGDFVMAILKVPRVGIERRCRLRAVGFTLERLEGRIYGGIFLAHPQFFPLTLAWSKQGEGLHAP
jgi:hypothetical protein